MGAIRQRQVPAVELFLFLCCIIGTSADKLWVRHAPFDSLISMTGTNMFARSRIHCARKCSENSTCESFFSTTGQVINGMSINCHLLDTVLRSPGLLAPMPNAVYYIQRKESPFVCPTDDLIFRTETISDGSSFTYRVMKTTKVNQATAKTNCNAEGGFLARVTNMAKMNFLLLLVKCPDNVAHDFYVDGSIEIGGSWVSEVGDPIPDDAWCDWCPDGTPPDCLRMAEHTDHMLNDCGCGASYFYICEK